MFSFIFASGIVVRKEDFSPSFVSRCCSKVPCWTQTEQVQTAKMRHNLYASTVDTAPTYITELLYMYSSPKSAAIIALCKTRVRVTGCRLYTSVCTLKPVVSSYVLNCPTPISFMYCCLELCEVCICKLFV